MAHLFNGIMMARAAVGGNAQLARLLGVTRQATHKWRRVPAERLFDVARVTRIAPQRLRPDLYRGRKSA